MPSRNLLLHFWFLLLPPFLLAFLLLSLKLHSGFFISSTLNSTHKLVLQLFVNSCSFVWFLEVYECRCAILGAGFAGLSVAWHLLQVFSFFFSPRFSIGIFLEFLFILCAYCRVFQEVSRNYKPWTFANFLYNFVLLLSKFIFQNSCKELQLSIDLYDEIGIGGGASGVAGGLLHPYSPKGFCLTILPS